MNYNSDMYRAFGRHAATTHRRGVQPRGLPATGVGSLLDKHGLPLSRRARRPAPVENRCRTGTGRLFQHLAGHGWGRLLALGLWLMVSGGCGAAGGGGGGGGGQPGDPDGPAHSNVTAQATAPTSALLQAGRAAQVTLDASQSTSANGEIVSYDWLDDSCGVLATGVVAQVELGVGEHPITLTVTDATGASDEADLVVTVVDDRPSSFALTTAVEGSGQTNPPAGAPTSFALNSVATVTATPDPGWQFVGWSGDSAATTASVGVVIDDERTLTALFDPIPDGGVPLFHAPWAAHKTRTTGQANDGTFSHAGRYAWDYTVEIGTPVVAAAPGRVVRIIDDLPNNEEGVTTDPDAPANMVQLDHGGGLQSLYAHLDQFGVAVRAGQRVAAGQYLGRSGNSGYSTGPHLHYEILDPSGNSISSGFVEVVGNEGIAEEGDPVTSQNVLDAESLDDYVESTLPTDAFAANNIELTEPTPPAFFYTTGETHTVTGRVTDRATSVCMALVDLETSETVYCDPRPVHLDGSFELDFTFPHELQGNYVMGVVSGVGGVQGQAPVTVLLSPPDAGNTPPTVTVEQPADDTIDFGGSGALSGSGSDTDGDSLTYLWAQTSGPPADIADPTSPQTTFTVGVGNGITALRFQLTASDGTYSSLPAEVKFRMPDNLHVASMGVTDQDCDELEECAAIADSALSADEGLIVVWVELLNGAAGDLVSFEVRDPAGQTVLTGPICDPLEEDYEQLFLRYSWSGGPLASGGGQWQAVFLRNGIDEASTTFTLN